MSPYVRAGEFLERSKTQLFLRPADVALIPQVRMLQPKGHPAQARFSKGHLEAWETLKNAA